MNVKDKIIANKIIAIVRGLSGDSLIKTAEALYGGGIRLLEITYDHSGKISEEETATNLRILSERFEGRMEIGAGTVLTTHEVEVAAESGAKYIISPDTNKGVIERTKELGLISIPGALTPTEITSAYLYGADFVKLFPSGDLGLSYIKSIRAPLNHIPMLAVGGVDENNISDFIKLGLCGVGIGSNIVDKKLISAGQFDKLTELATRYTSKI